jgi:hypothetical protein
VKTPDGKAFFDKVQKLYTVMNDMGNPFMKETGDGFTLDTKMIGRPSVAEMVASRYENGKTLWRLPLSLSGAEKKIPSSHIL